MRSRTIDQLEIGEQAEFTKTVTEADVAMFVAITGDVNPVHVDAIYSESGPFGARIAHGPLTLSLSAGVIGTELPGLGTVAVSNSIDYMAPVYIGDTVRTRVSVASLDLERRRATLALEWSNQDGVTVAEGEAVVSPPRVSQSS